jgi:beta-xylosidase
MQPNMQSHVLQLRNELHFRYVRIWGLYDEETFLMSQGAEHTYYYGVLDSVLDFLTTNHIKPWLELGAKGKKIVGTNRKRIYDSSKFNVFKDEKSLREFMHELMTHLVNRYGMEVVAEWYFELWGQEINEKEKSAVVFQKYVQDYLDNFEIAAGAIRGVIKEAHIGGSGIPCNYGETVILDLFSKWTKREQKPDFVSISVYPYVIQDSTEESIQGRFISPSFLAKMIEKVEMIKNHSGLEACQLHVTEWNLSIVSNNYIHDSCLKGAYILKNVIDIIGCDSILAYWVGSDLSLYCGGKQRCLNGAGGLLTTDGIRKPAWWAFDFLNSLGKRFFLKTDHCIVTDDGYGNWRIACHNYTHLNHKYYMMEEGTVKVSEIQDVCMDTKCENLSFILPTHEDKMYQIKIYSVNTQHGSVLNEWQNMSFEEAMSKEDINYLRSICIPNLRIINVMSEDGELSFDTLLEQNEIQLIQVNQLMK